jgi:hypothetical protein
MRTLVLFVVAILGSLSSAAIATAQTSDPDPADFTPPGYEFCGWKDFQNHRWTMEWDDSLTGASFVVFADGMSCDAARHNANRVRYRRSDGYKPRREGYTCKTIESGYEYSDVRCTKVNGTRRFRFQTGA